MQEKKKKSGKKKENDKNNKCNSATDLQPHHVSPPSLKPNSVLQLCCIILLDHGWHKADCEVRITPPVKLQGGEGAGSICKMSSPPTQDYTALSSNNKASHATRYKEVPSKSLQKVKRVTFSEYNAQLNPF